MQSGKKFRYLLDPVCLAACAGYGINRWLLKPRAGAGFLHNHFNDILFIPAALPLVLGLHRAIGLRKHNAHPTFTELASHTAIWSLIAEWLGPSLFQRGTADWRDTLAYFAGAALAWMLWRHDSPGIS